MRNQLLFEAVAHVGRDNDYVEPLRPEIMMISSLAGEEEIAYENEDT